MVQRRQLIESDQTAALHAEAVYAMLSSIGGTVDVYYDFAARDRERKGALSEVQASEYPDMEPTLR